jgi:hypothetical protein
MILYTKLFENINELKAEQAKAELSNTNASSFRKNQCRYSNREET